MISINRISVIKNLFCDIIKWWRFFSITNSVCDITNSLFYITNSFCNFVLKKNVCFHSYRREKIIARAFTARINGIQITIWASTWDFSTVAMVQAVQLRLASEFPVGIWASTWACGTYRIVECRKVRRACANMQTQQSLRCSHKWHTNC